MGQPDPTQSRPNPTDGSTQPNAISTQPDRWVNPTHGQLWSESEMAGWERVVERVADGDWERGGDVKERHGEQHHRTGGWLLCKH